MPIQWRGSLASATLGFVLLSAQPGQSQDALNFFKNYFITGDYEVGGVGLSGTGVNGLATGAIDIDGVPVDAEGKPAAEILAAFLYWQVVSKKSLGPDSGVDGATFNGVPLSSPDGPIAKVLDPAGTAPCWSSGGGTGKSGGAHRTYTYRADVLRFLDVDPDTGRHIVDGNLVQVPDSGGRGVPDALGASLVVVYRNPDPTTPLNAIVFYDGGYTMDNSTQMMSQTIAGFYDPASGAGKMTHIVGSGQANKSERLLVPGSEVFNPFQAFQGASWDNVTLDTDSAGVMPQDSVTTSVDHDGFSTFDCLSWGAIIYRTEVQDTDEDGLLDRWETEQLFDPNGQALPDLAAMGADPMRKNVFVEVGYMFADGDPATVPLDGVVRYGGVGGVDKPAHTHLLSAEAVKLAGDTFANAPVPNPDGSTGIDLHFDVGNNYQMGEADPYIIPAGLARGGEAIDEMETVMCTPDPLKPWVCQFSAFPGTVGWKSGYRFIRDDLKNQPPETYPELCEEPGNDGLGEPCERVFDRARKDSFRYALSAHALGVPQVSCVDADGFPDFDCQDTNPLYHVPATFSGVADFPGADILETLGFFDDSKGHPIGTDYMQAATFVHELGHTFWRRHGGDIGNTNCNPNYLSVMNYLFQLRGLINADGDVVVDYSGQLLGPLDESSLDEFSGLGLDSKGEPSPYRTAWYAPQGPATIGSAATKHCNGSPLLVNEPPTLRVDGTSVGGEIDWNADGDITTDEVGQDVNFDGVPNDNTAPLNGSDDWDAIQLNQVGSRRSVGAWFFDVDPVTGDGGVFMGPMSLDAGRGDFGRGDFGRGDFGRGDFGRGDFGLGDLGRGDFGRGDFGRGDFGRGDFGRGDFGRGDFGRGDFGQGELGIGAQDGPPGELTFELSSALGHTPPNALKSTVRGSGDDNCLGLSPLECHGIRLDWKPPNVGTVFLYRIFRVEAGPVEIGTVSAVLGQIDYFFFDNEEFADGEPVTHFVVAEFVDATTSGPSNFTTVLAVNDPPVAVDDSYATEEATPLVVAALGSLENDTDVDSAALTAALDAGPSNGMLALNADGSFTYTPNLGFTGDDWFTYTANDLDPNRSSNVATVTIAVQDFTPPLVNLVVPPPDGGGGYFKTSPVIVPVSAADASFVVSIACTSPIVPGSLSGIGTPAASALVSVSGEGTHNLICTATDSPGNTGAAAGSLNAGIVMIDTMAPDITIAAPADNAEYFLNASVAADYTCSEPPPLPGSGVSTCSDTVPSGSDFDTSTVGPKSFTVTATDIAGNFSTKTNNYVVSYVVTASPLKRSAKQGSAVSIVWQLQDAMGNSISSLSTLVKMESVFSGPVPPGGCVPSPIGTKEILFSVPDGATGNSSLRFVQNSLSYKFNWDTTTVMTAPIITGKGCYTVVFHLDDQSSAKMTSAVQIK